MQGEIKTWGNSYALRLTKSDLRRLGLRPGQRVLVDIRPAPEERVDVSALPVARDGVPFRQAWRQYYEGRPDKWQP